MDRRHFLKQAVVTAALGSARVPSPGFAEPGRSQKEQDLHDLATYDFLFPRVKFACQHNVQDYWHVRPGGDANLLRELSKTVRCKTKPVAGSNNWSPSEAYEGQLNAVVTLDDLERLKRFPFLFMTGESRYRLEPQERENLREYLESGGFLLMDDCMAPDNGVHFYYSSYAMLNDLFGKGAVRPIPKSHEIFHNVFEMKDGLPFMNGKRNGAQGVFIGDRLSVVLSSHDIHCGWADGTGRIFRGPSMADAHHGKYRHKDAIQAGINIIMYAMAH